jgi:hypothetical protein
MKWCAMLWFDVKWNTVIWSDTIWYGMKLCEHEMIMMRHEMIWCDKV